MNASRIRSGALNALLLLFSIVAGLALVELSLRALLHREYYVWPPNLKTTFHPSPEWLPGIAGESRFRINASGMRADPLPAADAFRVLAVGGSTTECLYLDQMEAWPQLVQDALNPRPGSTHVWVGNVGRSGRNARHHVLQVGKLLDTHGAIDLVLVLVGVNDMTLRLSADADPSPWADEPPAYRMKLMNEAFAVHQDDSVSLPLYKRAAIWRVLRQVKRGMIAPSNYFLYQDDTGAALQEWRTQRRNAARVRETLPDLSAALAEYAADIGAIVDEAQSRRVRIVLMTQPALWRPDLPERLSALLWLGGVGQFHEGKSDEYYSVAALSDAMGRYNATLLRVCAERNVECIDLAAKLPQDETAFYDDVHFNESGARMVAEIVSQYLNGSKGN